MKQYEIVKKSPIFMEISVAIIALGLVFFAVRGFMFGLDKTLNLGIDFTGGTIMTVDLKQDFDEDKIRTIVENLGVEDVQVQKSTPSQASDELTVAVIRFREEKGKKLADNQETLRNLVSEELKKAYPNMSTNPQDNTITSIGASVSRELIQNAIVAVLLACAAILVYVSWRFDSGVKGVKATRALNTLVLAVALVVFYIFRNNLWIVVSVTGITIFLILFFSVRSKMYSGLAAVLALLHDVLIMFTAMIIFYTPLSSSFVAAALTIIGYSINDTIVIFDRIRENEAKFLAKQMSHSSIANISINETLTRTINTSVTTLGTAIAIYVLGVTSIKEFAFPLIIGLIAGVYSSIFIAAPIWAFWKDAGSDKKLAKKSA
ncbi:MAG TPA: protein translocase subunit SecF [Clostridia bacterium]|nr:protein translocase subunit SecF [Clostridia bacterium]